MAVTARPEAPPGVIAALRRSRMLRVAGVVWILLFGGLAAADGSALQVPGWFSWGAATLLLPGLVLFALVALPLLPFARLRRAGIAIGALLATGVALLWALVVTVGIAWFDSPYGIIPWLDAGSVAGFARRHPTLSVSTLPIDTMVRDSSGRAVQLNRGDVPHARFAFEACDPPPLADRLGGLPPPALPCRFRYRLARDGDERLVYVFERALARRDDWTPLPYDDWARARGAEIDVRRDGSGRRSVGELVMRGAERTWQVRFIGTHFRQTVLIAEGGGPLRLAAPP